MRDGVYPAALAAKDFNGTEFYELHARRSEAALPENTSKRKSKRASAIPPLRKGASDEEIIRWTTTHDVFDRLEAGVSEIVTDRSELDQLLQAVGRISGMRGLSRRYGVTLTMCGWG